MVNGERSPAEGVAKTDGRDHSPNREQQGARPRANDLDGRCWTRHSLSVWSDIRKTPEEIALDCPALFPEQLVERLLRTFLSGTGKTVLDPFAGSGSTVVAAARCGHHGLGLELSADFVQLAQRRLEQGAKAALAAGGTGQIWQADARELSHWVQPASVDLVITSPPYWDVLSRRRSADHRPVRDYRRFDRRVGQETKAARARHGDLAERPVSDRLPSEMDLSCIPDYGRFLHELQSVFATVHQALRPGGLCLVIVMDLRKGGRFYPFHADLAQHLQMVGFIWEDLIIWDRRQEYNHLRPLGYPWVFRVNKVHEYILIFRRPSSA